MLLSNQLVYDGSLKCGTPEVANQVLHIPNRSLLKPGDSGLSPSEAWLENAMKVETRVSFLNTYLMPARETGVMTESPITEKLPLCIKLSRLFVNAGFQKLALESSPPTDPN